MANIEVKISEEEKVQMLKAIKAYEGKTVSVATMAKSIGMNPNRARFVVDELLTEEKVSRHVTKAFNARYIRYAYKINK